MPPFTVMNFRRRKQIDWLLTELPSLKQVPKDDNRFQLTLHFATSASDSSSSSSAPHLARTSSLPGPNGKTLSYDNQYPPTSSATATNITSSSTGNGGPTAVMTIYLPPGFPDEEPKITIQPTVKHHWIDASVTPCAVTGHERLLPGAWSAHTNLGILVKDIVSNIERTGVLIGNGDHNEAFNHHNGSSQAYEVYSHKPPPPIPAGGNRPKGGTQFNTFTIPFSQPNGKGNGISSSTKDAYQTQSRPPLPPQSSSSPSVTAATAAATSTTYSTPLSAESRIITGLSPEQIEEYLENPIAFDHFFDNLEVVLESRTLKREWWQGNDNVSRRNLQLEGELGELQKSTMEGYDVSMQLQKTLEEKLQQQQDALWRFKPETIQSKLRSAASESDEFSEAIAQSFLEGKLDQDDFIRQYRELRKVYHLREMRNERIATILRNHSACSNFNAPPTGKGQDMLSGLGMKGRPGIGMGSNSSPGPGSGPGSGSGSGSGPGLGDGSGGPAGHGHGASSDTWVVV
ncbi:hypothetical protein B0O80DRAFT_117825 [Mortierella sp. GBAus27b]|nr:Vacuolar protein sorting-associated protein 37A [Mortierella sp. GBA43]KAI8351407.1 hypothetical protein B0O80DRAFT_117825 [Mortierella sp. GBAus27b]